MYSGPCRLVRTSRPSSPDGNRYPASASSSTRWWVSSRTRYIQAGSDSLPPSSKRACTDRSRAGPGEMFHRLLPPDAVGPLVPQYPLSASTTRAPARAADSAAHVPAGPPPRTRTSATIARSLTKRTEWPRQRRPLRCVRTAGGGGTAGRAESSLPPVGAVWIPFDRRLTGSSEQGFSSACAECRRSRSNDRANNPGRVATRIRAAVGGTALYGGRICTPRTGNRWTTGQ